MKLDKIFSFLVRKTQILPLFNDAADNLVLASELLIKLVRERILPKTGVHKQIKDVEHIGDIAETCSMNSAVLSSRHLKGRTYELINNMDDVVDYIHAASKRITL